MKKFIICLGWWMIFACFFSFMLGFVDGLTSNSFNLLNTYGWLAACIAPLIAILGIVTSKLPFTQKESSEGKLKTILLILGWFVIINFVLMVLGGIYAALPIIRGEQAAGFNNGYGLGIEFRERYSLVINIFSFTVAIIGTLTNKLPFTQKVNIQMKEDSSEQG